MVILYYKKAFNINVFLGFSTVSTVHSPKPQKERYIHSGTQESFSKWRFLCTTCTNYTKEGEIMTDYSNLRQKVLKPNIKHFIIQDYTTRKVRTQQAILFW